jgi:hypothetical protein
MYKRLGKTESSFPLAPYALALGTSALDTTELVIVGLLPEVSSDLGETGETFVGHPSQQEGVAGGELVELEILPLLAHKLEGPAWIFHDAVQRHELRYDHFSHVDSPLEVEARTIPLGITAHPASGIGASRNSPIIETSQSVRSRTALPGGMK